MRIARYVALLVLLFAGAESAGVAPPAALQAQEPLDSRAFMAQYCLGCHNQQARRRGTVPVALDALDPAQVAPDAQTPCNVHRLVPARIVNENDFVHNLERDLAVAALDCLRGVIRREHHDDSLAGDHR
jgi:hypothetical protein